MLHALTNTVVWHILKTDKDAFSSVESIFKILAIIAAAVWTYLVFVRKREHYPRASLSQEVSFRALSGGNRLVRVLLTLKNEGEVLLKVKTGHTWVQQIRPWPDHLLNPEQPLLEVPWPLIAEKRFSKFEIEPKESDVLYDTTGQPKRLSSRITSLKTQVSHKHATISQ